MKAITGTLAALALLNSGLSYADTASISITPGLWEITSTSTNPITGGEQTQTLQQCMAEDKFDPVTQMKQDGCEVTNSSLDGNTLTFVLSCDVEGGQGTMQGSYSIDGDKGEGHMIINFLINGQVMETESHSVAKRLGDC